MRVRGMLGHRIETGRPIETWQGSSSQNREGGKSGGEKGQGDAAEGGRRDVVWGENQTAMRP